jgi:RNA polymerase sigma-70 factor (ECF subfamily)
MNKKSQHILTQWLVLQAQSGTKGAIDSLLRIWYPKLLGYALRICNNRELAKDAVQETLVAVATKLRSLSDSAAFNAWVYRILQLKIADQHRKASREDQFQYLDSADEHQPLTPLDELVQQETAERVLAKLSREEYQLVYLHYVEQFSLGQISEICAIPVGTLKSRLFTLREKLKPLIGEDNE